MKYRRFIYPLVLGLTLPLLVISLAMAAPARVGTISLSPAEGKIDDSFTVNGYGFDGNQICRIYFSSDKAEEESKIYTAVTAYEHLGLANTDASGDFTEEKYFSVPEELIDGKVKEHVHGGQHYVYATYYDSTSIMAAAGFTVIGG